MNSYTTRELFKNIKAKGIAVSSKDRYSFSKHDYFQVLNAYKGIFISGIETIDDILSNIDNGLNIDRYKISFCVKKYADVTDFKNKICNFIILKYGLKTSKGSPLSDKVKEINEIKYIHHIYKNNTVFSDFCRMYEFEHDLRMLLMKYTLIIENNIKRIFISYLNNKKKPSDYLVDISNYNTSGPVNYRNGAIESIKKVVDLLGNEHSHPIKHKRDQNLIVPYWILINEMTLNQTLSTIKNLNTDDSNHIFQECLHQFTDCKSVDIFNSFGKTTNQILLEQNHIKYFKFIIRYIGEFRNMLAHNQPIFNYNISDTSLERFPSFAYEYPNPNRNDSRPEIVQQHSMNATLMGYVKRFFGSDWFNSRSADINVDLSLVIYLICRIIKRISADNSFKNELIDIYMKYNIILSYPPLYGVDHLTLNTIIHTISQNIINFTDLEDVKKLVNDKKPYKMAFNKTISKAKLFNKNINDALTYLSKKSKRSRYSPFGNCAEYKLFTNIDATFLFKL